MRRPVFILFCFLAFAAVYCGGHWAHITLVERLRILAIRAEPPEVDIFGEVELSALIGDPQGGGREPACTWAVCLFELGSVATDIACPGPDSYYLTGNCDSATLRLADLAAWLAEQGYPIDDIDPQNPPMEELPLIVGLQVRAGEEQTRGFKRIGVRLVAKDEDFNSNPRLLGVSIGGTLWVPGDPPVEVAAGQEILVVPEADESTRQLYRREEEDEERLEDFLFSWFTTSGEFLFRRTMLEIDSHGQRLDVNHWKLPPDVLVSENTLWLVVRDGRYGADWIEVPVNIQSPGPP